MTKATIKSHLAQLCKLYNLSSPIGEITRVYGGLLHIMWHVRTDEGSYAIKQLSKDINLNSDVIVQSYELSEDIASKFAIQGIPAIYALKNDDCEYLSDIDNVGFLVYPWIEASTLTESQIYDSHASQIAVILAKMHLMRLDIPNIQESKFEVSTSAELLELIETATKYNCSYASDLQKYSLDLFAINDGYKYAISELKSNTIVGHGDLDPKNVLWDNLDKPVLIDWESARKLNPTYEIISACLDWSGITKEFNRLLFCKMLGSYTQAGGIVDPAMIDAAFYGVLGNWINWLVYNIKRSCNANDLEQKTIGTEQVILVLPTILLLKELMPELIRICKL